MLRLSFPRRPGLSRRPGRWRSRRRLPQPEALEARMLLAADLGLSLDDNLVAGVPREYATPGSQLTYTVSLSNRGDQGASDAALRVNLPAGIARATWTAAYAGGADGPVVGAAGPNARVNLPAGGSATFTIVATVAAGASGELVSTATLTHGGQTLTATDTDRLLPRTIAVSDTARWEGAPRVRLLDAVTGATVVEIDAFESSFRGGVQAGLADLDGDGRLEVLAVPGRGRTGEVAVFRQEVGTGGGVRLVRDANFALEPFGPRYRGGLALAVGDFDGNKRDDFAVAKTGDDGLVRVYASRPGTANRVALVRSFVPNVPGRQAGISLAAGDFGTFGGATTDAATPDGKAELVVGSGAGDKALVKVIDVSRPGAPVLDSFRPLGSFRGGVAVSVARITKDAIPDLVVSQGRYGRSGIEVYDGAVASAANTRLAAFVTFADQQSVQPVFATGVDLDGDGRANVIRVLQSGDDGSAARTFTITDGAANTVTITRDTQAASFAALGRVAAALPPSSGIITTASGLQYRDVVVGTGANPSSDKARVTVNYEGWLLDGTRFDGNDGMSFALNGVIKGWTEGLQSMKVGGRRQLIVPPDLAYGQAGTANIPPNSPLVFDVTLLSTT